MNIEDIVLDMDEREPVKKETISTTRELLDEIEQYYQGSLAISSALKLPDNYREELTDYVFHRGIKECDKNVEAALKVVDFHLREKELYLEDSQGDDYFKILSLFRGIVFTNCDIHVSYISLTNEVRYDKCEFYEDLNIDPTSIKAIVDKPVFDSCIFFKTLTLAPDEELDLRSEKPKVTATLFQTCSFLKEIFVSYLHFDAPLFFDVTHGIDFGCELSDENLFYGERKRSAIHILKIHDCSFGNKSGFYLNEYDIGLVSILRSKFDCKFEFKNNVTKRTFCIDDCNFEKVTDFFKSVFFQFRMHKTVFESFAAFENTTFGSKGKSRDKAAEFKYVTFKGFTNFRDANFIDGLDISKANFSQTPNFLGAYIDPQNTPRETFRIIKNSFDSVGNYIEANKFFSFEMQKHRESFKKGWFSSGEAFVFHINDAISHFGESYLLPIFWIVVSAAIYAILVLAIENNIFLTVLPISTYEYLRGSGFITLIECMLSGLNVIAKSIPPINHFLLEGMEFISLTFNLIFSVLIWQTIIAVKRLTRR